jgi:proteasome lid subunit RPN8/RPN11
MRVERYAATKELDVIGFYHSHPDHPAVPSQYDLVHAWPVYSYVIIRVEAAIPGELRSWELETDRSKFNEEEVLSTKGKYKCQSQ